MFVSPRFLSPVLGLALTIFVSAKEPFKPNLGPDLPRITVTCGDVTLLLRQVTQWTPGRIDFRGKPMTTESSAYGTVFSFPDVGFIGTAHLENEPEKLQALDFFLDDKLIEAPTAELKGGGFRLERKSRIRAFDLTNITEIKDHRLYETTTVHTAEAVPLKLVYHFMHAWRPTVSAFLAGSDAAPEKQISGPLRDDTEVVRKFYINERVDWMAVYEPQSGQFAVSRLLQAPELGGQIATIWNVPGTYRKFYLKCFNNATVPADFTGTWRMVTAFGSSPPEAWEAAARTLAAQLQAR
ncbi:hypothetical protein [Prosthecobacter sp.]|uniref:hypothetical protein n=1 Tax=Prosthecobacter sp. TaxID=1965333 RepID=UPI00248A598D|nr:hypothetical protein [Prosthecobacter sp.]MDI1315040.1 hypothetical protein [Prosthecobacter sp.]